PSVAVPFGVFERVLEEPWNKKIAESYSELTSRIDGRMDCPEEVLAQIKDSVMRLAAPPDLAESLLGAVEREDLPLPESWDGAWKSIKEVWGSKWNRRACLGRRAAGISDDDLFMAVLIQKAVDAEYSFVIHTVNPLTGNAVEIYAEAVLGLGEALVGNYPGRAFSFSVNKKTLSSRVVSFPSKGTGLFGGGLFFRSDSNGEDLSSYAGAGLYDSFMIPSPKKVILDYTGKPLLWDEDFIQGFMRKIGEIGMAVEEALQGPQDIEGAYSKGKYYVVQSRPQVGLKRNFF
ncbi:MAG: PEP/pyruvate-binding domain-containing protein, partial [Nitrospirota bacterium]